MTILSFGNEDKTRFLVNTYVFNFSVLFWYDNRKVELRCLTVGHVETVFLRNLDIIDVYKLDSNKHVIVYIIEYG